jgi:glycosyltransferase involved in cell wall biosynthesis
MPRGSPVSHHLVLDLSRLMSRAERAVPTGIDRVELAYAEHMIAAHRDRLSFAGMLSWGRFGRLRTPVAIGLVAALGRIWRSDPPDLAAVDAAASAIRGLRFERLWRGELGLRGALRRAAGRPVYLDVSHHHLDRPEIIARLKRRTGTLFGCFVHDVIPVEFPEYVRPGHDARHARRMTTVAAHADFVIFNSAATRDAFQPFLERAGRAPPRLVAPLGVETPAPRLPAQPDQAGRGAPYFVCVGTIEARKNHLLLLNVWRRLATELGPAAPRLVLVGQRGWENEQVIDMIERCPAIQGLVEEHNGLSDTAMARLLADARALLLPSFAEGYGLPIVEAFALGVPVLCSDVRAFREVAGGIAEYFDPLDGPAWHAAMLDYAPPASPRRAAQCERLAAWRAPRWADHFAAVDALIADVVRVAG